MVYPGGRDCKGNLRLAHVSTRLWAESGGQLLQFHLSSRISHPLPQQQPVDVDFGRANGPRAGLFEAVDDVDR